MNYPPPSPYSQQPYAPVLPTSTLAIVSLIAGVLGFAGFPIIGSIIAIVTGMMAQQETRAVPPRASGDGMATAGIVMGWIQIALSACAICGALAYLFVLFFIIGAATVNQSVLPDLQLLF
jgi:hypothetical protein